MFFITATDRDGNDWDLFVVANTVKEAAAMHAAYYEQSDFVLIIAYLLPVSAPEGVIDWIKLSRTVIK